MHPLQQISDSGLQQVRKEEKPAHAHVHAHELLAVFSDQSVETKRMATVFKLAVGGARLTQEQLEQELSAALTLADEVDKRNGFVSTKEARYGQKRSSMNTVSSMIRQVWGGLVHCGLSNTHTSDGAQVTPKVQENTGFSQAVAICRKALKEQNIKWNGSRLPTEAEKAAKTETSLLKVQQAAYADEFPIQAGETIADFQKRQALAVEVRVVDAKEKAQETSMRTMADKLWKELGPDGCAILADLLFERFDAHALVAQGQSDTNEAGETL